MNGVKSLLHCCDAKHLRQSVEAMSVDFDPGGERGRVPVQFMGGTVVRAIRHNNYETTQGSRFGEPWVVLNQRVKPNSNAIWTGKSMYTGFDRSPS